MSKAIIDLEILRTNLFRSNTSKLVLFCLLRDVGEDGIIYTSASSVAKEMDVCEKTVRNVLSEYSKYGIIEEQSPIPSPKKARYLGRCIKLNIAAVYNEKQKNKVRTKSDTKSDIVMTKSSSIALSNGTADLDFVDPMFKDAFCAWIEYKATEFREKYKTERALRAAYKNLVELSDNDPRAAMMIVEQSMANRWKGLFELKKQYGTAKQTYTPDGGKIDQYSELEDAANAILRRSADFFAPGDD